MIICMIAQKSTLIFDGISEGGKMDITLERILSLIPKKPDGKFKHGAIAAFARDLGFKDGHIVSDWIAGNATSYNNYLYEIADKYKVSVAWLRGETDIEKPVPTNEDGLTASQKELIRILPLLTDYEVSVLLATAQSLIGGRTLRDGL